MCVRVINGGNYTMNKKLVALLAVATMGISVVGATPQTQFTKGETQVDLGASSVETKTGGVDYAHKWNFDGDITHALGNKTAIQYGYHGLNSKHSDTNMHEVNLIQTLSKNFAMYGGWGRIHNDKFDKTNNIAQAGVIAKADLGSKVAVYGKAGVGTHNTTTWEAGLGYKATDDLDINAGYRYINSKINHHQNATYQGPVVGLSYRFGGSEKAEPIAVTPAPAPAPVVEHTAPPVQKPAKADYYVQSIYFDSDQDVPRADQGSNLQAALNAANQYKNDQVKLLGNADTDANPQYNIGLSERRVQDVAQYLVNHGVDANRLIGIANGDAKPVATNATANGKAENRRVDVFIHR